MSKASGERAAWLLLVALAGCTPATPGDTSGSESSGTGGATTVEDPSIASTGGIQTVTSETQGTGESADASTGTSGTTGEDITTGEDACATAVAAVSEALASPRCSLLLHHDSAGALLGWHAECGGVPEPADLFDAKAASAISDCCNDGGALLNEEGDSPFLFYKKPVAPNKGGLAIISNNVAALLFDATIDIAVPGTISLPTRWESPESLGLGACPAGDFSFPMLTSYYAGEGVPVTGEALALLEAAIGATALPAALNGDTRASLSIVIAYEPAYEIQNTTYVALLELQTP